MSNLSSGQYELMTRPVIGDSPIAGRWLFASGWEKEVGQCHLFC